jgi:CubicO group peptidase (beta-lactamase class C family)
MSLLGQILCLRSGLSYEDLVRTRILDPLGMASTCLYQEPPGHLLAAPYLRRNQATDYFMLPLGLEGAGRIRSTARDMARFLQGAMDPEPSALGAAFRLAQASHFTEPTSDGGTLELGLGWGRSRVGGSLLLAHNGGTWGFSASLHVDVRNQCGAVMLTNSRHDRDCLPSFLTFWITQQQRQLKVDPASLAEYQGSYATPDGAVTMTFEQNRLFCTIPRQPKFRVYPQASDRFFLIQRDLQLRFQRDGKGRISGLELAGPGYGAGQGQAEACRPCAGLP